jgi:hypothetical protein
MAKYWLVLLLLLSGCQQAYYSTMEKVGVHKRDILVDRVENAQKSQREAQEQFSSALEQFSALVKYDGGDLQRQYKLTQAEYDACEKSALDVKNRIDAIEQVAEALFKEWQQELNEYSNQSLKRDSERKLSQTRRQYHSLLVTMRQAEATMQPVLSSLKDNALYLKHNLNAQAIGALKGEFGSIERDISRLLAEMNKAIAESERFLTTLKQ